MSVNSQISIQQKIDLLGKISFFQNIKQEFHQSIASHLGAKKFAANEYIFKQGDTGRELFIVYEGNIEISNSGVTLANLEAGDIFGEMAAISKNVRTASALATSDVTILFLKAQALYKLIHQTPDLALGLLDIVTQRLRETNAKLHGMGTEEIRIPIPTETTSIAIGKKCPNCYDYNPDEAKVCQYCGTRFRSKFSKFLVISTSILMIACTAYFYKVVSPAQKPTQSKAKRVSTVQVTEVIPETVQMKVRTYGRVATTKIAQITPEIKGRVVQVNKKLKRGEFISKGKLLVAIDDTDYQLSLKRLEVNHKLIQADLLRLKVNKKNLAKQIRFVNEHVELAIKKEKNKKKLYLQRVGSQEIWEEARKEYLALAANLAALKTEYSSLSQQIESTQLNIQDANLAIEEARLNIERTRLVCPFDARVKSENIQVGDLVDPAKVLAILEDYKIVDIRSSVNQDYLARLFENPGDIKEIFNKNKELSATVVHRVGKTQYKWPGKIHRFEPMNENNYSIPFIVRITDPWSHSENPPLETGAFTEVIIHGRTISDAILIPRSSLREDYTVHLAKENRLHICPVKVLDFSGDRAILEKGFLAKGDFVITNALLYPVEGTPLNIVKELE